MIQQQQPMSDEFYAMLVYFRLQLTLGYPPGGGLSWNDLTLGNFTVDIISAVAQDRLCRHLTAKVKLTR